MLELFVHLSSNRLASIVLPCYEKRQHAQQPWHLMAALPRVAEGTGTFYTIPVQSRLGSTGKVIGRELGSAQNPRRAPSREADGALYGVAFERILYFYLKEHACRRSEIFIICESVLVVATTASTEELERKTSEQNFRTRDVPQPHALPAGRATRGSTRWGRLTTTPTSGRKWLKITTSTFMKSRHAHRFIPKSRAHRWCPHGRQTNSDLPCVGCLN